MRHIGLFLAIFLAGCQSPVPSSLSVTDTSSLRPAIVEQELFDALTDSSMTPHPVLSVQSIFTLSAQQRSDFLRYFNASEHQHEAGHQRLFNYLDSRLSNFHFRGQTYTASEGLTENSGNCLTLAVITAALAEAAGLSFDFQEVNTAPVYQKYQKIMTLSSHVRTRVYDPDFVPAENTLVIRRPGIIIDYFPANGDFYGGGVAFNALVGRFYQNLASEALVKHQWASAYHYLMAAYNADPSNPEILNTFAVYYKQKGDLSRAEIIYQLVLKHSLGSVNLISNYAGLLRQLDRVAEADALLVGYENIDDDNPYRWLVLADEKYQRGVYHRAGHFYKRALELAPYLAEAYFGIAKTAYSLQQPQTATAALQKAIELSFVPEKRLLYKGKLLHLSQIGTSATD